MRIALIALVILSGLIVAIGWQGLGDQVATAVMPSAKLVREQIASTVPATGVVSSRVEVDISAPLAGRLVVVHVRPGARVDAGQALARLDDREARALYGKAEAIMALRQRELALAEATARRLEKSASAGFVSPQRLDDARTQRDVAQAQLGVARADLLLARTRMDDLVIRAPVAGLVSESNAQVGEWTGRIDATAIFNPKVLFRIIDPDALVVSARIDEADIADVMIGQAVLLDSESARGAGFRGRVVDLSPVMHEHNGRRVSLVQIEPERDAPLLIEGSQVDLRIVIDERDAALTLPFGAVERLSATEAVVTVIRDGQSTRLRVGTGIESLTRVEILGNELVEGDTILLATGDGVGTSTPR
jgi:RND family efflux transporter MFP subunit